MKLRFGFIAVLGVVLASLGAKAAAADTLDYTLTEVTTSAGAPTDTLIATWSINTADLAPPTCPSQGISGACTVSGVSGTVGFGTDTNVTLFAPTPGGESIPGGTTTLFFFNTTDTGGVALNDIVGPDDTLSLLPELVCPSGGTDCPLYSGSESDPTMSTGMFTLVADPASGMYYGATFTLDVTSAVATPESSMILMMALGLVGVLFCRKLRLA
jgi:hypothetical protein